MSATPHSIKAPVVAHATRLDGRYLSLWIALGALSAAYLGIVAWQQTQSIDTALVPVTESIERLAADIADLKQTAAALDAQQRTTMAQMGAVESRLDGLAQVAAANVVPAIPTLVPPAKKAAPVAKPVAGANAWSPAVAGSMPAAVTAVSPIRVGSITPAPTGNPSGLLIASGPSLESIKLSWSVLRLNHAELLGTKEPRFVPTPDGSAFNLIAGPFASGEEAESACVSLKTHGVGCKPAPYTGAAL